MKSRKSRCLNFRRSAVPGAAGLAARRCSDIMPLMQSPAAMLWRRLDLAGHDACRLERHGDAWQLDGAAVFRQADGRVAQLHYRVRCDRAWHAQWGTVRGWLGTAAVDLNVAHNAKGIWTLNDVPVPDVAHCVDLDLGFTPATNLIQIRRLNLALGESAEAPAAWLDLNDLKEGGLSLLGQHYERRGDTGYGYKAERFGYDALLDVTADGFVRDYPGLWLAEG